MYSVTDIVVAYRKRLGTEEALGDGEHQDIFFGATKHNELVCDSLHTQLLTMDPTAFEHHLQHILEGMDHQDVEVTKSWGDGGVDVIADNELGISSVKKVVQAWRYRRKIQSKDLDTFWGSLHRLGDDLGTIITTSRFSKGTETAAFEKGAASKTFIDGDKLIDILILHNIGNRKCPVKVFTAKPESFKDLVPDAG